MMKTISAAIIAVPIICGLMNVACLIAEVRIANIAAAMICFGASVFNVYRLRDVFTQR